MGFERDSMDIEPMLKYYLQLGVRRYQRKTWTIFFQILVRLARRTRFLKVPGGLSNGVALLEESLQSKFNCAWREGIS